MSEGKCAYCEHSMDIHNFSNRQSLGWRFILTILSWIMLGAFIPDGKFYFTTIFLVIAPLAVDYMKFSPEQSKGRLWLKKISLFVCIIFIIFCFCGYSFMELKTIDSIQYVIIDNGFVALKNYKLNILYVWFSLIIFPILTIVDFFANSTVGEIKSLNSKPNAA